MKKVVGAVVLAEKMAQFDAAKFAELQKASGGGDSGKKDKKKAEKLRKLTKIMRPQMARQTFFIFIINKPEI